MPKLKLSFIPFMFMLFSCDASHLNESRISSEDPYKTPNSFYKHYKFSLQGGSDSKVDNFTNDLYSVMTENKVEEFQIKHADLGKKFFLAYVSENCSACYDAENAFKEFEKNFSKYVREDETNKFSLVTIFTDEETSETTGYETAFDQYLKRHGNFFGEALTSIFESDYYKNGHLSDNDISSVGSIDNFRTPTIFLVELEAGPTSQNFTTGVSELMFDIDGTDTKSRAFTLSDCWTHKGDFSKNPE